MSGKTPLQVHLDKHGVASVTNGAEPDLAKGLAENVQVFLFELLEYAGDKFRGFHVAGGGFYGKRLLLAAIGL